MLVLEKGSKTGEPGEKGRLSTTNSTHIWQQERIEPGPQWSDWQLFSPDTNPPPQGRYAAH